MRRQWISPRARLAAFMRFEGLDEAHRAEKIDALYVLF
jgi:hypothetical protein